jgi:hypothetical protein
MYCIYMQVGINFINCEGNKNIIYHVTIIHLLFTLLDQRLDWFVFGSSLIGEKGDKQLLCHTIAWACVGRLIAIERL